MTTQTPAPARPSPPPGSWGRWLHGLLTADHFPELDRRLRRLFWNPLGGLVLACAIALLCGFFLHPRAFVLAFGLLAVLLIGVAWPWLALWGLRGSARFSLPRCREGEQVRAEVEVANRLLWPAWGVHSSGDFTASLPVVPALGAARADWAFSPPGRGVYPRSPLQVGTGFPFGLFEPSRPVEVERELIVWPTTFPVVAVPAPEGENSLEGAVSRNKAGSSGDVLGVRPYRRGDSPRRIHWAQTARHDRLIVCELQSTARPLVLVALDDHPASHAGEGPSGSREWAIRVAASLCEAWMKEGAEVAAPIGGNYFTPSAGTAHHRNLMDAFARLDGPTPAPAELLGQGEWQKFRGTRVVVTTDRGLAGLPRLGEGVLAVVLQAGAFDGQLPVAPPQEAWLWIDDPVRVAAQARRQRGGAA